MALSTDIFDAVTARLKLFEPAVTCRFGPDQLQSNDSPPRVVWVPGNDAFGPASSRGSSRETPIARHTALTLVEAHIWGDDWAAAELLRDRFVRALRLCLGANYHLTGGRWVGSSDIQSAGKLYVLTFQLDIPITDEPAARAAGTVVIHREDQSDATFVTP